MLENVLCLKVLREKSITSEMVLGTFYNINHIYFISINIIQYMYNDKAIIKWQAKQQLRDSYNTVVKLSDTWAILMSSRKGLFMLSSRRKSESWEDFFFSFETGSQPCSAGWPAALYVDQDGLKLINLPASSWVLVLKECTTNPDREKNLEKRMC